MLRTFNSNTKQNMFSLMNSYPNCKILMIIDNGTDDDGYLVGISEEPETFDELCSLRDNYPSNTIFYMGGFYEQYQTASIQTVL